MNKKLLKKIKNDLGILTKEELKDKIDKVGYKNVKELHDYKDFDIKIDSFEIRMEIYDILKNIIENYKLKDDYRIYEDDVVVNYFNKKGITIAKNKELKVFFYEDIVNKLESKIINKRYDLLQESIKETLEECIEFNK